MTVRNPETFATLDVDDATINDIKRRLEATGVEYYMNFITEGINGTRIILPGIALEADVNSTRQSDASEHDGAEVEP